MTDLTKKRIYLLDMDGTLYLGEQLFEGTKDFLKMIRDIGGRYMFLTNNSSKSVDKYVEKMARLGIETTEEDFYTSTNATIQFLKPRNYRKIYALGTRSFKEQLSAAGLPVVEDVEDGIDCLCMGYDTELTYKKLDDASQILIREGVDYIATNPDWVCPTEYGYVPDCGSIAEALWHATKRRPQFIGKPQPEMIDLAVALSGFSKEEAIIFGDRLYTDIRSGYNAGITTCFVLSGEGTMQDVEESDFRPDLIFKDIREYTEHLRTLL
ncbi:MAG: HAD-IIA family hydrolase [Lachnospiraceae bacterium]|nr:HAD-IIA family hydrolase [Lachnospiraceae bacterium]